MHGIVLSFLILSALRSSCGNSISEYVLVSQPRLGVVLAAEVDALSRAILRQPFGLVTKGLRQPMGLAVDQTRQRLFVADAKSRKVFMYNLMYNDGVLAVHHQRHIAVKGLTPHWIAVDKEDGSLFCSDQARNAVVEMRGEEISQLTSPGRHSTKFHVLYSPDTTLAVDSPGGVAVDGFHVFWGNKAHGRNVGSVVRGFEDRQGRALHVPGAVAALTKKVDKVYGLCASGSNIFYTGESRFVYRARKQSSGIEPRALFSNFRRPRGCAWDGDGTIYLADEGGHAVFSFPSASQNHGRLHANQLFEVEEPYGIAVLRPPANAVSGVNLLAMKRVKEESDKTKEQFAAFGTVVAVSVLVYVMAGFLLPRTPPMRPKEAALYVFPKLVEYLESIPFTAVIVVLTLVDLVCSIFEVLGASWAMGDELDENVKEAAEIFGFAIAVWMVIEQTTSLIAQGFRTFFADCGQIVSFVVVMIDFFVDVFAEDASGIVGILLFIRLFKIFKVIQTLREADEHAEDLEKELQTAEGKNAKARRPPTLAAEPGKSFWCC